AERLWQRRSVAAPCAGLARGSHCFLRRRQRSLLARRHAARHRSGQATATAGGAARKDPPAARAALVALAEGPAVAAFAAARVGVPGSNEAGLSYSGQAVRGDFRHAFDWGAYALSTGLGLTGRFGQTSVDLPPNTDLSGAHGV